MIRRRRREICFEIQPKYMEIWQENKKNEHFWWGKNDSRYMASLTDLVSNNKLGAPEWTKTIPDTIPAQLPQFLLRDR